MPALIVCQKTIFPGRPKKSWNPKYQFQGISMENIKFFEYLTTFSNLQGDEMPEPKNMLEATAEANNLASLSESKEIYMRGMEDVCGTEKPYVNEQVLEMEHLRIRGMINWIKIILSPSIIMLLIKSWGCEFIFLFQEYYTFL